MLTDQQKAEVHLSRLAETFMDWREVCAQWLASIYVSSGMPFGDFLRESIDVVERLKELCDHENLIWPSLVPGGRGPQEPLQTDEERLWVKTHEMLHERPNKSGDEYAWWFVERIESIWREAGLIDGSQMPTLMMTTPMRIVSMNDSEWIVYDKTTASMYVLDNPEFFTNISDPDGDEVRPGHVVSFDKAYWDNVAALVDDEVLAEHYN